MTSEIPISKSDKFPRACIDSGVQIAVVGNCKLRLMVASTVTPLDPFRQIEFIDLATCDKMVLDR